MFGYALVSAKPDHAVVLAFVDQTVVVGNDAPTRAASSVRITLEKACVSPWRRSAAAPDLRIRTGVTN